VVEGHVGGPKAKVAGVQPVRELSRVLSGGPVADVALMFMVSLNTVASVLKMSDGAHGQD
jgi:hypothetical protein